MIRPFPARTAGRIFGYTAPLLLLLPLLSGCEDKNYPADMRYPARSDPIFTVPNTVSVSGDELTYPDRPGQLPILTVLNAEELTSPLHKVYEEKKLLDPRQLPADLRQQLTAALEKHFGTPAAPKVEGLPAGDEELLKGNKELQKSLKVENMSVPEYLAKGSHYYRIHCLHCHGLPGDGRGPTGFWVNPHPRDYRQGIFKFVSVNLPQNVQQKPRREDLLRTLRQGIDGTSMPSFVLLGEKDLNFLASYVIHLSLRGEVEYYIMQKLLTGGSLEASVAEEVQTVVAAFGQNWIKAQDPKLVVEPVPYPLKDDKEIEAAVQRGQKFFMDSKTGCVACHTDYGRHAKFRYDAWGTLVRPTDLTLGIYRGGRRPIDLYWRLYSGINGSGMAPFKDAPEQTKKIQSLWDMVKFVEILPYPAMRKKYGIHLD